MKHIIFGILFTVNVLASPTIYGPTGLIEMPSAEAVAYKQISVGVDYSIQTLDSEGTFITNLIWDHLKIGSWVFLAAHF